MRTPHAIAASCALAALLAACASPDEICSEKFASVEAMRREAGANVIRQEGECRAVAAEFPGDKALLDNCRQTLRAVADTAQSTEAFAAKLMTEPDLQGCQTPNR